MSKEIINNNFDINTKYKDMIKTAKAIVANHEFVSDGKSEPSIHVSLAYDVRTYLPKLLQENKKCKEVINKAKKWVKNRINHCTIEANSTTTDTMCRITIVGLNNLLDILKEVEHE